jgi:hypothetical protein
VQTAFILIVSVTAWARAPMLMAPPSPMLGAPSEVTSGGWTMWQAATRSDRAARRVIAVSFVA